MRLLRRARALSALQVVMRRRSSVHRSCGEVAQGVGLSHSESIASLFVSITEMLE